MKVVINRCYGGFSLSREALQLLFDRTEDIYVFVHNEDFGIESGNHYAYRTDPRLVEVVEKLGQAASGSVADLQVVEIPDDIDWVIEEYDGLEWVAESHRTWS